jgi:predicted PurR-regulated permease PerM
VRDEHDAPTVSAVPPQPTPATAVPAGVSDPDAPDLVDAGRDEPIVFDGPPRHEPVSPRTVFRWAVAAGLGLFVVYLAVLLAYLTRDLLVQIGVAAFIALSLDPAVRWLIRHRVRRRYAVSIILVLFLIAVGAVVWLAAPPMATEAGRLATDFPGYLENLRHRSPGFADLENRLGLAPKLNAFAANFVGLVQSEALAFGQRVLGALVSTLLVVVLTIYFMADLPRLRRAIVRGFPARHRPHVSHAVNVVIDKVGAYMIGNLIISAIAGVTTFVALLALRVPFALPLAFFVAVTDLIPLVGATLGAVVGILVAAATGDLWPTTVLVTAFFVVYQQLENYLIAPRVLRDTVDIPSVGVLLAALVGASVLGLIGALIAIPIAAAIKVVLTPLVRARDDAAATADPPPPPPPPPPGFPADLGPDRGR